VVHFDTTTSFLDQCKTSIYIVKANYYAQKNYLLGAFMRFVYFILIILLSSFSQLFAQELKDKSFKERLGMGYFFFFDGPNLKEGTDLVTNRRGLTGNPINSYYIFSFKYKLTEKYFLDFQPGVQHWYTRVPRARFDRIRAGISGKLWQSGFWTLDGAANSDLPYTGYTANERTLIFSPGLFAGLSYKPTHSRWSMYMLVMPRVWFYADKDAVEPEWLEAKRDPGEKFQSIMQFTPTVNYAINDKLGLRSGIGLDYRKWVKDDWTTWRRWDTPLTAGVTYSFSKALNIYAFLQSFPFDGNRSGLNRPPYNGFRKDTSSVGMWLSGTIF
jgi:hypothetical protein